MCGLFSSPLSLPEFVKETKTPGNLLPHSDRLNELDSASIFPFVIIQITSLAFVNRIALFDEGINAFAVIGTIENL